MIQETEDTILWENLKENSIATDRLLYILVTTKVIICVSPLLWGNNDAVLGIPSDKYGWLSAEYDLTMAVHPDDPETSVHLQKYNIDVDEYMSIVEELEKVQYLEGSKSTESFEENTDISFENKNSENDLTRVGYGFGDPKLRTPGGDPIRIIRSKQLYEKLLTYYSSLSTTYGGSTFQSAIELWLQEIPTTIMDMPGFRGSQSWCLRGVLYISLNLYLLKAENYRIKNLGPEI